MLQIVTDSASLLTKESGQDLGVHVIPLQIMADGKTYKDNEEISLEKMTALCKSGVKVSSSQPALADKIDLYNTLLEDPQAQILDITMADGLSGTYQSAVMAKNQSDDPERILVFNSKCLGGPLQALVKKAAALRDQDKTAQEIVESLEQDAKTDISTVSVEDFHFLERSGRVSKGLAITGGLLKLIPTVIKTEDGTTLTNLGISRSFSKAADQVIHAFQKRGADESYSFFVLDGGNENAAKKAARQIQTAWPQASVEIIPLCPMFLVHGGPGCIAMQAIRISQD